MLILMILSVTSWEIKVISCHEFSVMQIVGFSIAVIFFALMRQAHAWDLDLPMPSMLVAVESNLRIPWPFLLLGFVPILFSLFISLLKSQPLPPLASFVFVSTICYVFANGSVILLVLVSQLVFYGVAIIHVFIKSRLVCLSSLCSILCGYGWHVYQCFNCLSQRPPWGRRGCVQGREWKQKKIAVFFIPYLIGYYFA